MGVIGSERKEIAIVRDDVYQMLALAIRLYTFEIPLDSRRFRKARPVSQSEVLRRVLGESDFQMGRSSTLSAE